jgi:hypothetical protein
MPNNAAQEQGLSLLSDAAQTPITQHVEKDDNDIKSRGNVEANRVQTPGEPSSSSFEPISAIDPGFSAGVLVWAQGLIREVLGCTEARVWIVEKTADATKSGHRLHSYKVTSGKDSRGGSADELRSAQVETICINQAKGFLASALNSGDKVRVDSASSDSSFDDVFDGLGHTSVEQLIYLPAVDRNGEVLAILHLVNSPKAPRFSKQDESMAGLFCRRLISAIRRDRRLQLRFSTLENEIHKLEESRKVWKAHYSSCKRFLQLFGLDRGCESADLHPRNLVARCSQVLRTALGADVATFGSVQQHKLLPFRLQRADKFSGAVAFRRLCTETIESRSINVKRDVEVTVQRQGCSPERKNLVLVCSPVLYTSQDVVATILVGIRSDLVTEDTNTQLVLFCSLMGMFFAQRHHALNAAILRPLSSSPSKADMSPKAIEEASGRSSPKLVSEN